VTNTANDGKSVKVFRSGVHALASRQRIRMELFRKLLFGRNDRERRRRDAAEAKPVFPGHDIQRLQHFVPNADVDVETRKVSSVHSCLDWIPAAASRSAVQIFCRFPNEEFEVVVEARRRRFLKHEAHLFTPLFRVLRETRAVVQRQVVSLAVLAECVRNSIA